MTNHMLISSHPVTNLDAMCARRVMIDDMKDGPTEADATIMALFDMWVGNGREPAELIDAMARLCIAIRDGMKDNG